MGGRCYKNNLWSIDHNNAPLRDNVLRAKDSAEKRKDGKFANILIATIKEVRHHYIIQVKMDNIKNFKDVGLLVGEHY